MELCEKYNEMLRTNRNTEILSQFFSLVWKGLELSDEMRQYCIEDSIRNYPIQDFTFSIEG